MERGTLFRDKLIVSKLPASRIGRSRERQTQKFDQAGSDLGGTAFENNRRDSIQTISFPIMKARGSMINAITKNYDYRDKIVRGWRSRRNMPSII